MQRAVPKFVVICVLAVVGCVRTTKQQSRDAAAGDAAVSDATVHDAGDASHQPSRDSGGADAADAGPAPTICTDTAKKWAALVATHSQCNHDGDCGKIDAWTYSSCDCLSTGTRDACRRDAVPLLSAFLDQVALQCPGLGWPPGGCDVSAMTNVRCENHVCTGDSYSCGVNTYDSGVPRADGG